MPPMKYANDTDLVTVKPDEPQVSCGGYGDLNHPRVYIKFDESNVIVCPYCSRRFTHST